MVPNVESFHVYEEGDEYLEGGRIIAYCDWCKRGWYENEKIKEENKGKKIEFKRLVWTQEDSLQEKKKQNPNDVWDVKIEINIPEGVKEIDENCFDDDDIKFSLIQITIPTTVTSIPKNCLKYCYYLTNITLPLNQNQIICGNQIFTTPHFDLFISLSTRIEVLNGKELNETKKIAWNSNFNNFNWIW